MRLGNAEATSEAGAHLFDAVLVADTTKDVFELLKGKLRGWYPELLLPPPPPDRWL